MRPVTSCLGHQPSQADVSYGFGGLTLPTKRPHTHSTHQDPMPARTPPVRSTVFVSNLSADHDYSATTEYGVLRPITMGNYPIFKIGRLVEEISKVVVHSTPQDYLVLSGSSVVSSLCLTLWMLRHGTCQLLLYDRGSSRYTMRILAREQLEAAFQYAQDTEPSETNP